MESLTKNRLKLVFIALLFALPVMSAWFVYKNPQLLEGAKTKNYGELISPAVPSLLEDFLTNPEQEQLQHLKGRWLMLHIDLDGRCNDECDKSVHSMRQLNVLLNKDSDRLKRVYLDMSKAVGEENRSDFPTDKDLNVFNWAKPQIDKLQGLVPGFVDGDILLLDPLGNIMMKYQQTADPYGIQKDMKLLLKASQIG